MNKLSEKKIIELFQNTLGNTNFVPEDVESFKIGKEQLVVKVDTFVESTDLPPKMKLEDAARKSIVSCVSDFASKGVKPIFGIVSLTIPKKLSRSNIQSLAKGFQIATREFGLKILGGDTNEGEELVITFSLFGTAKKIVKRNGAKTNDLIICSGPFGYSAAGLSILLKNKKYSKTFGVKAKRSVFRPNCRLEFGLKNKNYFSSAMDSSDGLSTTLNEMSIQSKKKFIITRTPSEKDISAFADLNRIHVEDLIFNGGEEYEIVATINPTHLESIKKYAKNHKIRLYEIGYVTKGRGVFLGRTAANSLGYKCKGNRRLNNNFSDFADSGVRIKDKGWQHLIVNTQEAKEFGETWKSHHQKRILDITGTIQDLEEPIEVLTKYGKKALVANAKLVDGKGIIILTLWGNDIQKVSNGTKVRIRGGFTKKFGNKVELNKSPKDGTMEILQR